MLQVTPVRAFADNYIWLIHSPRDPSRVAVVDPGDAEPVRSELKRSGLDLKVVLVTHHHPDHVGGVAALAAEFAAPVFGPARESIPAVGRKLAEGDHVALAELGLEFDVLDVPGHTSGHIAYVGEGVAFCGDTLFSAGCGRLFEGTPAQMNSSLGKLKNLPAETRVYCAHEYTLSNLRFALAVEPDNSAVQQHISVCEDLRQQNLPTVPSRMELEHAINPFLRCDAESVKRAAERHVGRTLDSEIDVFAVVREWKNNFRG